VHSYPRGTFVVPFFVLCHRVLRTKVSDPDPAFFLNTDPDPVPDPGVLMTKNFTAEFFIFDQIAIYGPP
jgi:hypothetical protein